MGKEVTFEENLKATGQQTGKTQKKSSKLDTKKKNQAKKLAAKGPDTEIKPVVQEPKRPETPIEEPEEEEIEAEVEPEPEVVEPEVIEPEVVEEVKQQSSAEATPKKSKKKKNKINIEGVDAAVEEIAAPRVIEAVEVPEPVQVEVVQKKTASQQQ